MKHDDAELIQRVLDGDDTAFSTLVKKHQKPVHALAWRKTGDFHVAEEITQDTFLKAYQNLSTLKEPQKFASWLYVIAANYCKMWRRKKRLSTQSLEDTDNAELEETAYSEYVIAENEQMAVETQREVVKQLLAKLQESDRTVITLYYLGEMTYEEISEFLGVSVASIKNRLYRARRRLKKEEPMIREALENFQITPNLTENIMREIERLKPAVPSGGKPLVPWAIGVSAVTIVLLMFGFSHQHLSRFQKPYSFNAASEIKVELIDAPVVLNLESEPDDRTQLGNANAQGENNGPDQQTNNAALLDLETIITKIKQYDNAVTSVTGDFVMERYSGFGSSKTEYTLTFEGEKVLVEQEEGFSRVGFYDGERTWEGNQDRRLLFEHEIAPDADIKTPEAIQQIFKEHGINLAGDVSIVDDDEPQSFTLIENETDQRYHFGLEGETTLWVYDLNHLRYGVRPQWGTISSDNDPRFWLTLCPASTNSYLSEPLWHLLEKHESEIIGNEILNGEKTTVIRLNIPAQPKGDSKKPDESVKLWISHDKGFRLVKLEESAYTIDNRSAGGDFKAGVTYISSREIAYHEYLPEVWFPKRIESSTAPVSSLEQQEKGEPVLKTVLLTKQCRLNTDVTELLRLGLPLDTFIFDYETGKPSTVGDVLNPVSKPNIRKLFGSSDMPGRSDEPDQHAYNPAVFDLETLITKMKHTDSSVVSASGDFVIEHHIRPGIAKTEYALTFEGDKIRVEREWGTPLAAKDYPLVKKVLPSVELDDGERRWEIYQYKKHLFSVEVALDKKKTVLETIRQAFKQQEIALADDVRIAASEEPESYTLIENQTGKTYFILWEGGTTLKVYDLQHTEYGIRDPFRRKVSDRRFESPLRYQWNMLSDLDPRYWLTYPSAGGRSYLTEPLWQRLEKHESELLGSEVLNGEETSVIRLKLPDESLIIWISHEKGFRLVKLQRAFPIENPVDIIAMKYFQSGVNYIETREIDYHEYLPDVWFPKKIERYFTPIEAADLPHVAEIILKTVIRTKQCRLNTDVAESLRLDLPPDTSIFGLKPEDDTPVAEKLAYLRQEIPRILKHRLDLEKLDDEIAESYSYGEDPDLTLLRDQVGYETDGLRDPTISYLVARYIQLTTDFSAFKPGGDFYELLEKNGFLIVLSRKMLWTVATGDGFQSQ